jgi:hypothetical protein
MGPVDAIEGGNESLGLLPLLVEVPDKMFSTELLSGL